jgi:hypothetical protein
MKNTERARLMQTYHRLYNLHYFAAPRAYTQGDCYYCGEPADGRDHSPPLAWIEARSLAAWRGSGIRLWLVPCCTHCNNALGDMPLFTLQERAEHICASLERKFEKKAVQWTADELLEMGPAFRRTIGAQMLKLQVLAERVRYAQWRVLHIDCE